MGGKSRQGRRGASQPLVLGTKGSVHYSWGFWRQQMATGAAAGKVELRNYSGHGAGGNCNRWCPTSERGLRPACGSSLGVAGGNLVWGWLTITPLTIEISAVVREKRHKTILRSPRLAVSCFFIAVCSAYTVSPKAARSGEPRT
jgi:hypothetical protein